MTFDLFQSQGRFGFLQRTDLIACHLNDDKEGIHLHKQNSVAHIFILGVSHQIYKEYFMTFRIAFLVLSHVLWSCRWHMITCFLATLGMLMDEMHENGWIMKLFLKKDLMVSLNRFN